MNNENKKVDEWIGRIRLSSKVNSEIEKMRFSILEDIHHKIDADEKKRYFPKRKLLIAASISLLMALSTWLTYQFSFFQADVKMQEIVCPLGARSTVILPDGTSVLLNSGSTLAYDVSTFGEKERRVILDGEAFFDVKKNEEIPFIVGSGVTLIKVLGTSFNVESYRTDEYVKVTLESGRVSLKITGRSEECILLPGQQAAYNKKKNKLTHHAVDVKEVIAWCNSEIVFSDTPLEEIARKLERRFNVHIIIQSETLRSICYNGAFTADDNLERILSFLSTMDHRLNYRIENKNIYIYEVSWK